jgi:prolyl 4-hydroxylase
MKHLNYDWIKWIAENVELVCNKKDLFLVLSNNGFDKTLIQQALDLTTPSDILQENIPYLKTAYNTAPILFNLSEERFKTAERVNTDKARIYIQRNFLTENECDKIIQQIDINLRPSTITDPNEPDKYFRTSKTCDLIYNDDPFIHLLDQKIADYMGIDIACSERIQGQYYEVGNEFKLHTDYFEPNTSEYEKFANQQGQRTWTFMIYLNTVKAGGETAFPRANFIGQPQQGAAVIWNNMDETGCVNPNTAHWAKPIIEGKKYVITKWFRERP